MRLSKEEAKIVQEWWEFIRGRLATVKPDGDELKLIARLEKYVAK